MLKRSLITIVALVSLTYTAYAADTDWSLHIKVSVPDSRTADGTVWNHLIAGVHEGATDGYDSAWDTLSMAETDDPIQAMFPHGSVPEDKDNDGMVDEWTCTNPEEEYDNYNCSLWGDIRAFETSKTWPFLALSTLNGGTVTLQWSFEDKPENIEIILVDLSNPASNIDMKNGYFYSYTNHFEAGKKYGIRYFDIRMEARGLFITPPALPDATVSTPYNKRLSAVGGIPVWSLEDGDLPPGMYIDAYTGEVTGTPTATGSYTFTVRGDDTASGYSSSKEYTLNINSIPKIDTLSLPDGVAGGNYNGRITVLGGSVPIKWRINNGNLPEGLTLDSRTGIISGTLIVPGVYDVTAIIEDANGATDSRGFRITIIEPEDKMPPEAIRDLSGIYLSDTSLLLFWSAPSDDSMTGTAAIYDFRYMEDCPTVIGLDEGTWDKAIEANGEPRPQAGALQTYTLTGLRGGKQYCIAVKSMDAKGHVSLISNIVGVPLSSAFSIAEFSEYATSLILNKGYNLISFPLIPVPNGRDSLFGLILGNPAALYRWYSAYPGITLPQYYLEDIIMPGLGYFLYSPAADVSININGLKIEKPEYGMALQHGWNMIGTPYAEVIMMRDIQVKKGSSGEIMSYIDAVKAGWIGNTIYQLKSGNYDFASFNDALPAALEPWVGYWIYVGGENGVEIIFKKPY